MIVVMRVTLSCATFVAVAAFALPPTVRAQATTTELTGTVQDSSGGVLPGALVTARHIDTGLQRTATAGPDGRYLMAGLPLGEWEIRVELSGFRPMVRRGVDLVVGQTSVIDARLDPGAPDEAITVTAEAPLVQTRSGELSYLVGEDAIRDLPLNGRNYTDLALLQPGVVGYPHRDGGSVVAHGLGMSINGQDPRSNVYLLDGTPLNDFTNGPAGSAAGTALGTETIREFRVEANAYGAEFGRNSGGQIHAVTKSGTNQRHGSGYLYHRNDAFDARNYFDPAEKPDFSRYQFGATFGGPIRHDRTFFFAGLEGLRERLGRTVSTVVPDDDARRGVLPGVGAIGVDPAIAPYLAAFPVANGANLGGGLAAHSFVFDQTLDQHFLQARLDQNVGAQDQLFVRYTFDDADQHLPTDFPQFPRDFISTNQFLTAEYRHVSSSTTLHTARLGWSRTRVGQDVEANLDEPLPVFVPGREFIGGIDIGGIPGRFGTQTTANLRLKQDVFGADYGIVHTRGRHLLKAGAMAERYVDDMVNPTFSLGIHTFGNLEGFLRNRSLRFVGLTPEATFDRQWRFTLLGAYVQDELRLGRTLSVNAGLRYEYATLPVDLQGRDSALINLSDPAPTTGRLYQNPTGNLSPRVSFAWDPWADGRTAVRGGYGLYFNTNNHQNLIVTVTNPPATPRVSIANPTFPVPPFERGLGNTIRPIQYDLDNPRTHVWNLNVQREFAGHTSVMLGYAGSRGVHLLRSGDVNVPTPVLRDDGTQFFAAGLPRPNPAFATIELKTSDGDSWYNAFLFEVRRRTTRGLGFQSSYTFSRNIDTTQASTFFSDATNGTTSAFPEFHDSNYNKGLADYHAKHNWVFNITYDIPGVGASGSFARGLLGGWQVAMIGQIRSGSPLTAFIRTNRSRSQWAPSLGPGLGFDRPSLAPGRTPEDAVTGNPDQWFDPAAFVLQPAGTLGNLGRGALIGPDLKTIDLALVKRIAWTALGQAGRLELRIEGFNIFNRANFGVPSLLAFAGTADNEAPLSTFGRIRSTVTSSRQIQVGARVVF
jgi:carboxypeptidase family protein/TonB-dependent receptor-like protein